MSEVQSKIETVAAAILHADVQMTTLRHPGIPLGVISASAERLADDYLALARAAIEAMREPTEGMLNNTVDERGTMRIIEFTSVDERGKSFLMPLFTWRAMIDAALNEQVAG